MRQVRVFPPQGLDAADSFFARQQTPGEATPGRRYLGICASGRNLKAAHIRVYVAYLSEGTLGGLVRLGVPDQPGRHIEGALEQMQYYTSDPLCAEHTCAQDRSLHEAACHACLFLPETSCERSSKYLDRSVLVPTMDRADLAFFET